MYTNPSPVLDGYGDFVFRNRFGELFNAHCINRATERIVRDYNLTGLEQAEAQDREPDPLPHFSAHNCRHTFCTRLCETTSDVKFIQSIMGHADFSTTMDIYTHISQASLQQKVTAIAGQMSLL